MSKRVDHTGEKKIATNGMEMEIIEYITSKDILPSEAEDDVLLDYATD